MIISAFDYVWLYNTLGLHDAIVMISWKKWEHWKVKQRTNRPEPLHLEISMKYVANALVASLPAICIIIFPN